jgi:SAM-dependent methyltransferase
MLTVDLDRLGPAQGARLLDLGCGRGRHAHALAARDGLTVVGVDADRVELEAARNGFRLFELRGWSLLQGDALALPFTDGAFDAVVCSEVLEHLPDYESALDEIARVTRPGGVFALSVPRGWPEAICWRLSESYRTTPGGHVRIFAAKTLKSDVAARGFAPAGRHGAHALHSPYWWLRCAVGDNADEHPLVKAYKAFLEWDIAARPALVRAVETLLNPLLGKSVVMYFRRLGAAA